MIWVVFGLMLGPARDEDLGTLIPSHWEAKVRAFLHFLRDG